MILSKIEQLLVQLEPKFLSKVQEYLEYLVSIQQHKFRAPAKKNKEQKHSDRLLDLRRFKGDAPFPNVTVSKSDIYEQ